jgi:hypothetical protein
LPCLPATNAVRWAARCTVRTAIQMRMFGRREHALEELPGAPRVDLAVHDHHAELPAEAIIGIIMLTPSRHPYHRRLARAPPHVVPACTPTAPRLVHEKDLRPGRRGERFDLRILLLKPGLDPAGCCSNALRSGR